MIAAAALLATVGCWLVFGGRSDAVAAGLGAISRASASEADALGHPTREAAASEVVSGRAASGAAPEPSMITRWRLLFATLAATGGIAVADGGVGWCVGAVAGVGVWVVAGRVEPASVRRTREETRRALPHVVGLISASLASGASTRDALRQVAGALPSRVTAPIALAAQRLDVGMPSAVVWELLGRDPAWAPLSRALARADDTGAPVATVLAVLGVELARDERARVEDQARQVGVRAAVPLGVCLLPAFLLLGIVPVVVATLSALSF